FTHALIHSFLHNVGFEIIITCEHAGNEIPESYSNLFPADAVGVLASHRGWDPGACGVATYLADRLNVPLFGCHTARLLIEVNRSLHHLELFSEYTGSLDDETKEELVRELYRPYRHSVIARITLAGSPVLHFSVHTFTPVLHSEVRAMDIGLLFDPARPWEVACCDFIRNSLQPSLPSMRVAFNEPYKGVDDGL